MRIDARITYGLLCNQLGVGDIPGIVGADGKPIDPDTTVLRLANVIVDADEAKAKLYEADEWDYEPVLADDPHALREFIDALLGGDVALARVFADRLFVDERMRLVAELALSPSMRAA